MTSMTVCVECLRDGKWHYANHLGLWEASKWSGPQPFGMTSYSLFWMLGGVRGRVGLPAPLFAGRGLPSDISETSQSVYRDDPQALSASWATVDELESVDQSAWEPAVGNPGSDYYKDVAELRRIGAGRIVYWFD